MSECEIRTQNDEEEGTPITNIIMSIICYHIIKDKENKTKKNCACLKKSF